MPLVPFCEGKGTAPVSLVGKIPDAIVSILPSKGEKTMETATISNNGVRNNTNHRPKRNKAEGDHREVDGDVGVKRNKVYRVGNE